MADLPPEDWEFFDDDPEDDSNLGVQPDHLREIMETYGIVDFNEIVVDLAAVPNPQDIRGSASPRWKKRLRSCSISVFSASPK